MATATSKTIYATPDRWGNVTEYAEHKQMQETINQLRKLGDEWKNISITDCEVFDLDAKGGVACHSNGREYVEFQQTSRPGFYAVKQWL